VNVQSYVGYQVCIGIKDVVLRKSRDVKIVQEAAGVSNMGGKANGGVGRKKGYLQELLGFDSYPASGWLMNTKRPSLHPAKPQSTS